MATHPSSIDISIIVPVFNLEDYVGATIESIMMQHATPELEILIVDDRSTDSTRDRALHYANVDSRIHVIDNTRSKCAAGARNTGLENASGSWIMFLDGDDLLTEGSIANRWAQIQGDDAIDFLAGGYLEWDAASGDKRSSRKIYPLSDYIQSLPNQCIIVSNPVVNLLQYPTLVWTGSAMVNKSLISKVGLFNERYLLGEDADLWLRLAATANKFVFLNSDLALYRLREKSLTRVGIPGSIWAAKSVIELRKDPGFRDYRSQMSTKIAKYQLNNSYYYREQRQYLNAIYASLSAVYHQISNVPAWKSLISSVFRR